MTPGGRRASNERARREARKTNTGALMKTANYEEEARFGRRGAILTSAVGRRVNWWVRYPPSVPHQILIKRLSD